MGFDFSDTKVIENTKNIQSLKSAFETHNVLQKQQQLFLEETLARIERSIEKIRDKL